MFHRSQTSHISHLGLQELVHPLSDSGSSSTADFDRPSSEYVCLVVWEIADGTLKNSEPHAPNIRVLRIRASSESFRLVFTISYAHVDGCANESRLLVCSIEDVAANSEVCEFYLDKEALPRPWSL